MYAPTSSAATFVEAAYISALGRAPDPAGGAYWINEIATGHIARSDFITALIAGARAPSGSATDAQYIANKEVVGAHFAITQGLTNVEWARVVERGINASAESVVAANQQTDIFATSAAMSTGSDLVVQLVGVIP